MKAMNRNEIWEALIEAETNERYYGVVSDVCRWWNTGARLLLITAASGSLAAVIAESQHQLWLAWLSFVAAFVEVIIKQVADWEKVGERANNWRLKWIDVRELAMDMWRKAREDDVATLDGEKMNKLVLAIEKERGYVPKAQWLIDRIALQVAKRRGA